jgi:hypothetical protein
MKNKLLLTIITFITALSISAVAIYYSVAGLAAIFAAAVIPIIIMGGVLEIAKLVTTVWLHRYWSQARWWLKTYLSVAVIVLMFITSMGIFGFLSKAHIEQTSASQESVAQVERYDNEIRRQTSLVERYEARIKQLESGGGGADASIQSQIDAEQKRIDSAYARIQPQIDEQNKIIEGQSKLFSDQITKIDSDLAVLQKYIDDKEVAKAQAMVGVSTDGAWGPGTARAVNTWKAQKAGERAQLVTKIQDINRDNSNIQAAREEIKRLRATVDVQVAESNKTIVRLRESLGKNKSEDIDSQLKEQLALLKTAQTALDEATKQKYALQTEYRKLEAEVGPIKYIAEFIYGDDADKNMLERAVRWVIITIIFVFDPLAVLLLLASQYSFEYHRRERKDLDTLLAETPDEPVPTPQPLLEEPPVVESESVPVESPPPTKLDEHMLSELNQTLSQELETQKEVADTWMSKFIQYSKLYDDERQEKAALQSEIERLKQLESDLATAQAERDRLAAAHGYEMERADALATQLVELQTVEPPAETPAVVSEPTVDSDVITVDDPLPVVEPQKTVTLQDIKTYGVTNQAIFYHPSEEYVNFEGKQISINALKGLRPDLLLSPGDPVNQILFGNTFPKYSKIGDIYIRTDAMPHIVFKFNGTKWIEVDKNQNTSYVQYIPYLQYLIQKCESGEYDADYLTDAEREEIESHLANK